MPIWWDKTKRWFEDHVGNAKDGLNPDKLAKVQFGLPSDGHVMAFGHFSSERNLDVFVLDSSKTRLHVYLWDRKKDTYSKSSVEIAIDAGSQIVNVVPADFDHDGHLDVLVMSGSTNKDEFELNGIHNNIFLGNGATLSPSGWVIPNSYTQLTPFDFKGFMQVDLLGSLSKGTGKLEVLQANAGSPDKLTNGYKRTQFEPALECGTETPHWNAFADVNGDGRPDLLLTCSKSTGLELIVLLAGVDGYDLAWRHMLPRGTSQLAVIDVDADGSPDLVFTVCSQPDNCTLHILYNVQLPFCSSKKDKIKCRSNAAHFGNGTGASAPFEFDGDHHQQIALSQILKGASLMRTDPLTSLPIPLSFGDYNLDGHPDLLLTVSSKASNADDSHAVLLQNVPCDGTPRIGCSTGKSVQQSRRTFAPRFDHVEALAAEKGIVQAAFADIKGKGGLSIIANGYTPGSDRPRMVTFHNEAYNDAFFVRAECLNSVCPAPCGRMATGSRAGQPYGVNYSGASFRLSFTDIDGSVRVRSASQLSQTSNRALQQPFAIFGLGRTNSFVDLFSAGVSSRLSGTPATHTSSHIIPNSDLIVIPPHADSPNDWTFQIHIHPAAHFIWVTVALATAMTILVSLTAFFKIQERREDDAEKRKRAHAINFDAM